MGDDERVLYRGTRYDSARWRGFAFRPGDIVISTPPKCGTTWVQMICALLILQEPVLRQPLSVLSPCLERRARARSDVVADLEAQGHRRFIKTHIPLDGLPLDPSVTYICVGRDPRDAALSMDSQRQNVNAAALGAARQAVPGDDGALPDAPSPHAGGKLERFWQWADDETPPTVLRPSLVRTLRHFRTFRDAPEGIHVVLLHFDDLRADLEGRMRSLADRLAVTVPEPRWPELVSAATLESMRARAAFTAPSAHEGVWRDDARFFRRGTSGQWKELLDAQGLARYRARVDAIGCPDDVVDWAHHGSL
ncbi:sulfotransferase domain-containing protein [Streptomyces rectiverticillatus]|uniref:sulfotransferase domain-containing protein n=1 Tax=Streptomyces rectiverticillatus TaxID=173860 RepID=UPI0015C380B4|nr:sulfotransferase domain-containing protein [Streptomyces rectiverticillatus]QLE70298.1 sulfotransferase domain-containing protein [Streptomyces rectiverticillatus]